MEEVMQEMVPEAVATLKYARISPRKVKIVADLLRGKNVDEALAIVKFTPKAASEIIEKVLKSAIANAENNHGMSHEKLYISDSTNIADLSNISASRRLLVKSIIRLRENGIEYQDLLDELDRATKMRIMPYISNTNYTVYEYDLNILDDLLSHMSVLFHFDYTDSNGLMMFDDTLEDLPFD